ncbi:LamG-like jellyroll fold domain-containing protein [Ruania halotolerans]|uniref:LamG-like jellyroll fold domain-containing protein n=1 Tax=Ruania halotolerans TaxID=2897773 RepID=UPI001E559DEF|nr:LamG-like jellyroll fold domain-containing protein [Ruania halotolerans]UFU08184.1 metallophosphoesterase [Ruania halotolerans]
MTGGSLLIERPLVRVRTRSVRIATAALAAAGAVLGVGSIAPSQPATAVEDVGSRFTLAVLPDTQFYSRYAQSNFVPDYGTDPFAVQTAWISAHADELNIPFVAHLGDLVDQVGVENEWVTADAAMRTLDDSGVPYSVLPGNHDVLDSNDARYDDMYDLAQEPYLDWFDAERIAGQPTEGETDATGLNQYQIFEAEGQRFMVLALTWRASDATLEWANGVIAEHPELPVILTSHDMIGVGNDGVTGFTSENGERLWERLIADNDQIFLTMNGHYHGAVVTERTNNSGNAVTQVLIDYQMAYEGGNGYMSLFEFDLTNDRIDVETVSPWVVYKPADSLTSYDEPVLDGAAQRFSIDIDFAERFSGFAPGFQAGQGEWPSLSERAVELITDGFVGVPGSQDVEPGSVDDYVEVDGTLAHWRMTGAEGTLEEGAVIEDVAGDSDLHRVPIAESGSSTAMEEDVSLVAQTYPYSSSGQAVCFAESDQQNDRFSFLATDADAPVNDADLSGGYTIETFVKMDESWTAEANAWSKFLVRSGNRSELPGMPVTRWDYTASPSSLGISNLREFQWSEVGEDATKGDKTNWSGEIMVGTWNHVVVVNDPDTAETTMYVNGAPVLRTAQDTIGQSFIEGMPWMIGADWSDDAARNGWNGCVGETRIIDRPTNSDEWLTARPDLSTFAVTAVPEVIDGSAQEAAIEGTGTPRATVTAAIGESAGFSAMAAALETTVGPDGTWSLAIPAGSLSQEETTVSLVQGFGSRVSEPQNVTLVLAAPEEPEPTDPADPDPTEPGAIDPEEPSQDDSDGLGNADGDTSGEDVDAGDALPTTGASVALWAVVSGVLLAAGLLVAARARMLRRG